MEKVKQGKKLFHGINFATLLESVMKMLNNTFVSPLNVTFFIIKISSLSSTVTKWRSYNEHEVNKGTNQAR